MIFRVMTPGGIYASPIEANDADEAESKAIAQGFTVFDVMDDIVVVEDGA